jgi:hypothetical protein
MPIEPDATEYTFQGESIAASYYPGGAGGPEIQGRPEMSFSYQDHHRSMVFGEEDVDVEQIDAVGALVSVRLVQSRLDGDRVTTFTVLVPAVGVEPGSPQTFKTKSITTIQAATYVQRQLHPALQTYKVDNLDGTANKWAVRPGVSHRCRALLLPGMRALSVNGTRFDPWRPARSPALPLWPSPHPLRTDVLRRDGRDRVPGVGRAVAAHLAGHAAGGGLRSGGVLRGCRERLQADVFRWSFCVVGLSSRSTGRGCSA